MSHNNGADRSLAQQPPHHCRKPGQWRSVTTRDGNSVE